MSRSDRVPAGDSSPGERGRLEKMIENYEKAIEALVEKAQQMLMYPLARTVHTTTEDGKQVVTEVHPAKWKMTDASEFYSDALALLDRIERLKAHADRIERAEVAEELPAWVPAYLAAWGGEQKSGEQKNGKRMTVSQAAEVAGTTSSNVRNLRTRSEQFKRLEWIARHGDTAYMQSMVEAGMRGNALLIFAAFMRLVQEGNTQAVLKAMEWLQDKPLRVKVEDDNLLSDEERARLVMGLLDAARARRDGGDSQE
jgi:hypothetical protein